MAKVGLARASGAGRLVAVRREVQIERQNLPLRQPVLESKRDDRLAQFRDDAPLARLSILSRDEELGDLLRDGRSALEHTAVTEITQRRARNGDDVDAGGSEEPPILGPNGG